MQLPDLQSSEILSITSGSDESSFFGYTGSRFECYYRIHDGLHFARPAYCKCLLQNIWIHKHDTGCKLFARFQAWALHENPSPLYVYCPGAQLHLINLIAAINFMFYLYTSFIAVCKF
jgi:hypothetical protein